jgi:hypothetical protein
MKHILVLFTNNPDKTFTVENLLFTHTLEKRGLKEGTAREYLTRLHKLKLIDKVKLGKNGVGFKLRDLDGARKYINGTLEHLTPHPPAPIREKTKRHRVTYLLQLSRDEIEQARRVGTFHARANSAGFYRVQNENFKMTTYLPSGKSEVFIYHEPEWRGEFEHIFGVELTYALEEQVLHKKGNSGLAHPITTMGDKIYVDDCLVRIGRSQLPLEIDVHGPEDKVEGDVVPALWEDMRFRGLVINAVTEIKDQNEIFSRAVNELATSHWEMGEAQNKALQEIKQSLAVLPTRDDIHELTNAMLKFVKMMEPLEKLTSNAPKEEIYPVNSPPTTPSKRPYDPSYQ